MRRNSNRRSHARIVAIARAYIVDGDSSITGCSLVDLSFSGAKLKVPYGSDIRGQLTLCVPSKGIERPIEVVWRSGDQIGVIFSMNILGHDEALVARSTEPSKPLSVDQLRRLALDAVSAEPGKSRKKPGRLAETLAISHWTKVWRAAAAKIEDEAAKFVRIVGGKARAIPTAGDGESLQRPDAPAEHQPQQDAGGEDLLASPESDAHRRLLGRQRRNMPLYAAAAAVLIAAIPAALVIFSGASANAPADHRAGAAAAAEVSTAAADRASTTAPNTPAFAAAPSADVSPAPPASETDAAAAPPENPSPPQGDDLLQPLPSVQQAPASGAETLGAPKDTTALWFQNAPLAPCLNYGQFAAGQAFQEMSAGPCETSDRPPAPDATP